MFRAFWGGFPYNHHLGEFPQWAGCAAFGDGFWRPFLLFFEILLSVLFSVWLSNQKTNNVWFDLKFKFIDRYTLTRNHIFLRDFRCNPCPNRNQIHGKGVVHLYLNWKGLKPTKTWQKRPRCWLLWNMLKLFPVLQCWQSFGTSHWQLKWNETRFSVCSIHVGIQMLAKHSLQAHLILMFQARVLFLQISLAVKTCGRWEFSRRAATKSTSVSDQTDYFILVQKCGPESQSQSILKQIIRARIIYPFRVSLLYISATSKISYIPELATGYMFGKCVGFGQCLHTNGRNRKFLCN